MAELYFRFRLCFRWFGFLCRGRFLFLAARRFRFLARWRLRVFRRCGFGFFLPLSRFRFGFLFGGGFRCFCGWGGGLLFFSLLLRDPLILRKHPVLQVRGNNIGGLSIRVDLDHAGSGGSSGPCCDASHEDSVDWRLEMFRGEFPHRQSIRRSCSFMMNNELRLAASQQVVRMLFDYFHAQFFAGSTLASAPLTITLLICNVSSEMTLPLSSFLRRSPSSLGLNPTPAETRALFRAAP